MTRENKRFALENTVLDAKYQIKELRSRMKTRGILLLASTLKNPALRAGQKQLNQKALRC